MNQPTPSARQTHGLRRYLAALLAGSLVAGVIGGLLEWWFEPSRVASGDTLAAHLAWRACSSTLAAMVCGLVVYSIVRPQTLERTISAAVLPVLTGLVSVTREHSLLRLILHTIPIGLVQGVFLRLTSAAARRWEQPPQD